MGYNRSIIKKSLTEITLETFKEAIYACYRDGITSFAPLGFSGDTVLLYAENGTPRVSQVSIRNYCNDAELLITDINGGFIFYGRYSITLGVEFIAFEYFRIFTKVIAAISEALPPKPDFSKCEIPENCERTIGFDMLKAYQNKFL